jgi:hypothetical protein
MSWLEKKAVLDLADFSVGVAIEILAIDAAKLFLSGESNTMLKVGKYEDCVVGRIKTSFVELPLDTRMLLSLLLCSKSEAFTTEVARLDCFLARYSRTFMMCCSLLLLSDAFRWFLVIS